ncbi:annexin A3, partial [Caerostris extrusa]
TDDKVIIDVLTSHSNVQRQIIKKKYKVMYGLSLEEDIKAELGGHFEDICLALLMPVADFIVECLHTALKGYRTDENCIIEVLVSLEYMELRYLKSVFKEKYKHDLGEFLSSGLRGDIQKLVTALTDKDREYFAEVDTDLALMEAHHLFDRWVEKVELGRLIEELGLGPGPVHHHPSDSQPGTTSSHDSRLRKVRWPFNGGSHQVEFGGNIRHALLAIVECIDNRPAFFAKQLHEALNGPGTDDKTIIRILVSRSEIDLSDIQEWYHMKYDEDLSEAIYADTSGDYRKMLLKILNP